tara:strand:- start:3361 stop:4050 length:690 start_codon:yes stop_codon:yes gene_type:complete
MDNSIILTGNKGLIGSFLQKKLPKLGYEVIGVDIEKDLTDKEVVVKLMEECNQSKYLINTFAMNDHIKNNPNINNIDDKKYNSLEIFKKYMDINVSTLYSVCDQFIKSRISGNIINFSSIYGLLSPDPSLYPNEKPKEIGYSVSKSAVISISAYFASHNAPNFIVNTLALGGIHNNQNQYFINNYSNKVPLGRMMKINEILPSILFLLDPNNSYMTGSVLTIDGGYSII